jgi:hypothetical protein
MCDDGARLTPIRVTVELLQIKLLLDQTSKIYL